MRNFAGGLFILALFAVIPVFSHLAHARSTKADPVRIEAERPLMGTTFRIALFASDADTARTAIHDAFIRIKALESVMSDYDPKSEVTQVCDRNDREPGKPIPISQDLCDILELSLNIARETDGAFDITIGPLSQLWRKTRKSMQLPPKEILADAKAKVGFQKLTLDRKARTLTMAVAGMRLDFGGIGKGFAADRALALLRKRGFPQALVAASGDITVGDAPPGRPGWIVDVASLGKDEAPRRIQLVNASVSTSGDLFQHVEIAGVRYSHVLDPKTGLGLTGRRSATVIAATGAEADSLTKGASLLPLDKLKSLIENRPHAAAFVMVKATEDAEIVTVQTPRFAGYEYKAKP